MIKDLPIKCDAVILQESKLEKVDKHIVKSLWSLRNIGWVSLDAKIPQAYDLDVEGA